MARLVAFFTEHRPDNAPKAGEFYAKVGPSVWAGLEKKYPGKTAKYTQVSVPCVCVCVLVCVCVCAASVCLIVYSVRDCVVVVAGA